MDFKELNNIVASKLNNQLSLAQDSFELARKFNLRIKNSTECKRDFPDKILLQNNNAVYALFKGEYTIYYNEKYAYKNFAIAHEVAHHLLKHESDGTVQHHDANILAALLIAPKESVIKNKIKNPCELSEKYIIPIEIAQIYWEYLNIKSLGKYKLYILLTIFLATILIIVGCVAYYIKLNTNPTSTSHNVNDIIETQTPPPSEPIDMGVNSTDDSSSLIVVTVSGKKYHHLDCFHIKNKSNIIEISINEAVNAGYKPCKDCIQ